MLAIGTKAPDFTLKDKDGKEVSLSEYRGSKVILYFYPKDSTAGCTKEACSFRDKKNELATEGFTVIGISRDSQKSHQRFAEKQNLNFTLLSDEDTSVIEAYEAWGEKSLYGKRYMGIIRMTYVIDEDGVIIKAYDKVKVSTHAEDILKDF